MARLRTRKKFVSKVSPEEVRSVTNMATDRIKKWTLHELEKLQKVNTSPICVAIRNGYKIGLYTLTILSNKTCEVYDHNKEYIHTFENKISGILYTIYTIKGMHMPALEILQLDVTINKNYTDMLTFRRNITRAKQKKDDVATDINVARLEVAEARLEIANDHMVRIRNYAKWHKVWE